MAQRHTETYNDTFRAADTKLDRGQTSSYKGRVVRTWQEYGAYNSSVDGRVISFGKRKHSEALMAALVEVEQS